jgi:hypothetical protein
MIPGVDPADLKIGRWNGVDWEIIKDVIIDTEANTVSVQIWHFSDYALISPPYIPPTTAILPVPTTTSRPASTTTQAPTVTPIPTPTLTKPVPTTTAIIPTTPVSQSFIVSDLIINPSKVKAGEITYISVKITNTSDISGNYVITLKINNTVEDTRIVTLDGGQNSTVEFIAISNEAGKYLVDINGFFGSFDVTISNTSLLPAWAWVLIGSALFIIMTGTAVWFWRRKIFPY